jgi:hypothetical protein
MPCFIHASIQPFLVDGHCCAAATRATATTTKPRGLAHLVLDQLFVDVPEFGLQLLDYFSVGDELFF